MDSGKWEGESVRKKERACDGARLSGSCPLSLHFRGSSDGEISSEKFYNGQITYHSGLAPSVLEEVRKCRMRIEYISCQIATRVTVVTQRRGILCRLSRTQHEIHESDIARNLPKSGALWHCLVY